MQYQMRQKMLSIGDDFWVEDGDGEKVFKVNGKAMRVRKTFLLETPDGDEVLKIQERRMRLRGTMKIERDGDTLATVKKAVVDPVRSRFTIDVEGGDDLQAQGNIVDHEYEIERDGDTVATISKKWFRVRDSYGVDVAAGEDVPLILAITVAIDSLTTRR